MELAQFVRNLYGGVQRHTVLRYRGIETCVCIVYTSHKLVCAFDCMVQCGRFENCIRGLDLHRERLQPDFQNNIELEFLGKPNSQDEQVLMKDSQCGFVRDMLTFGCIFLSTEAIDENCCPELVVWNQVIRQMYPLSFR